MNGVVSQSSKKSIRRSLAHSDADVAELSNRQSTRSALDRQRLAASISQYQDRRLRISSWYEQETWPRLLSSVHGMWDYSQLHTEPQYMKRYWGEIGVSTESDRKRQLQAPFLTLPKTENKGFYE